MQLLDHLYAFLALTPQELTNSGSAAFTQTAIGINLACHAFPAFSSRIEGAKKRQANALRAIWATSSDEQLPVDKERVDTKVKELDRYNDGLSKNGHFAFKILSWISIIYGLFLLYFGRSDSLSILIILVWPIYFLYLLLLGGVLILYGFICLKIYAGFTKPKEPKLSEIKNFLSSADPPKMGSDKSSDQK